MMQAASSCIKCSAPLIINGDVDEEFDVDFNASAVDQYKEEQAKRAKIEVEAPEAQAVE